MRKARTQAESGHRNSRVRNGAMKAIADSNTETKEIIIRVVCGVVNESKISKLRGFTWRRWRLTGEGSELDLGEYRVWVRNEAGRVLPAAAADQNPEVWLQRELEDLSRCWLEKRKRGLSKTHWGTQDKNVRQGTDYCKQTIWWRFILSAGHKYCWSICHRWGAGRSEEDSTQGRRADAVENYSDSPRSVSSSSVIL